MDQLIISLVDKGWWGIALFTLITCLCSGLLSMILGLEREINGQAAGLRTHVIVAMASSLMMTLSIYAINLATKHTTTFSGLSYDASRIAAGIVAGVGFMGAGAIVKNGSHVKGLTTAATLWLASGIGMACGCGFVLEAVVVTVIAVILLIGLVRIEVLLDKISPKVTITAVASTPLVHEIREESANCNLTIKVISSKSVKDESGADFRQYEVIYAMSTSTVYIADFIERFSCKPNVKSIVPANIRGRGENL